jgi:hypothetical protein
VSYRFEWIAAPVFLWAMFLLLIGPFAVIAVTVVAVAALAALVALAGAVLALPYLLVRSLHRHFAERRQSTAGVEAAVTEPATFRAELSRA